MQQNLAYWNCKRMCGGISHVSFSLSLSTSLLLAYLQYRSAESRKGLQGVDKDLVCFLVIVQLCIFHADPPFALPIGRLLWSLWAHWSFLVIVKKQQKLVVFSIKIIRGHAAWLQNCSISRHLKLIARLTNKKHGCFLHVAKFWYFYLASHIQGDFSKMYNIYGVERFWTGLVTGMWIFFA